MSLQGAVRAFAAASRRAEREQQRRSRVAAQQFKQLQKRQAVTSAAQAVASYNDYVAVIKSVHHDCSVPLNWPQMLQESPPLVPSPSTTHQRTAQAALEAYQPGFFDRLFKRGPTKTKRLEAVLAAGRLRDQQLTTEGLAEHQRQLAEWQTRQELTRQVLAKDSDAYPQVLEIFSTFADIEYIGSRLEFVFTADHIEVDVHVNTTDVIPDFVVTQLASGKLSRKALAGSKFNDLYQDYVCGCLLRVAREVQAHLPVSMVVVHALANQLNPATGFIESQVIVSTAMPRATLEKLNFSTLDPSDAMRNFNHTMKFTKTGGFQAVERVGLAAPLASRKR